MAKQKLNRIMMTTTLLQDVAVALEKEARSSGKSKTVILDEALRVRLGMT